jgi:integrase
MAKAKKAAAGEGSIRFRAGAWRIELRDGKDLAGKPVRLTRTVKAPNTRAGQAQALAVLEQLRNVKSNHEAIPTLSGLLDRWIDVMGPQWSPSTSALRRSRARTAAEQIVSGVRMGDVPIDQLRTRHFDELFGKLLEGGRSKSTVAGFRREMRAAFNVAMKWGLVTGNPVSETAVLKVSQRPTTTPSLGEASRVLAELVTRPKWHSLVRVAANAGFRRGELAGFRWYDVDWERRSIAVQRRVVVGDRGLQVLDATKNGSVDRIVLGELTIAVLREWQEHQVAYCREAFHLELRDSDPIWPARNDPRTIWDPRQITHAWRRVAAEVGIPNTRLHDMRHLVATQLLADGHAPSDVADRLRHDPVVLMEVYRHAIEGRDRQLADRMDQLLG